MSPYHHGDLPAALLKAAETILERDGIGALTMRAAAREAGVSHAAPGHHFGDLSGLLTELAASGFTRFRDSVEVHAAGASPGERVRALTRGYVAFAQSHPGLFQLMFRSERLDWGRASLASAGAAAFALLTGSEVMPDHAAEHFSLEALAAAMAQWSFAHGIAMLLLDGRLDAFVAKAPGTNIEALIQETLKRHP